ncbi:MAG TPA: cytochrome c peroxidase [Burkholderiales bacterium]|nr:cytochrome c peroxidase [Burkholderiales bacterium]
MKKIERPVTRCAVLLAAMAAFNAVPGFADDAALLARAQQLFKPLPANAATPERPVTPELVALGRALFFENRVSTDGRVSCAACHLPSFYGAEPLPRTVGNQGKILPRNTPTVFNTALQFVQHYGGNRVDVEEQAVKALISPLAYGNADYAAAEARLRALPGYRALFEKAFPNEPEPVTAHNWGRAIGAYERTLLTPAPFDRYLSGDPSALSAQAKRGLDKFIAVGCAGCHNGVVVGGQMYQKFGITQDYWTLTGSEEIDLFKGRDKGRFHDTKNEADAYIFKVQQLRNVAVTPPYFHDGSVAELRDAVRIMAKLQLGRELTDADVSDIVAFLESLTGEVPAQFANVPVLPVAAYRK